MFWVFLLTKTPPKVLGYKIVLRGTFWKIWHIQIQIYPQTYIEPKYGAFYLKNKVSVHGLVLLVQLSWRVAPPLRKNLFDYKFTLSIPLCLGVTVRGGDKHTNTRTSQTIVIHTDISTFIRGPANGLGWVRKNWKVVLL